MKKFEYKTVLVDTDWEYEHDSIDETFNTLGEKGWELVTAATDNAMDGDGDTYTRYIWYTFKREIE